MTASRLPAEVIEEIIELVIELESAADHGAGSLSFCLPYCRPFEVQRRLLDLARVNRTWLRACLSSFYSFFTYANYARGWEAERAICRLGVLRSLHSHRLRSIQVLCVELDNQTDGGDREEHCHMIDDGLSAIVASLPHLRALSISGTASFRRSHYPAIWSSLSKLRELKSLNVTCNEDDEILLDLILSFRPSLEELHIDYAWYMSAETVREIVAMPRLRSLDLGTGNEFDERDPEGPIPVAAPITRLGILSICPRTLDASNGVYLAILRARASFLKQVHFRGSPPFALLQQAVADNPTALSQLEEFRWDYGYEGLTDVLDLLTALRPPKLVRLYLRDSALVHSRLMVWVASHPLPRMPMVVLLRSDDGVDCRAAEATQVLRLFLSRHGVELSSRQPGSDYQV